MTEEHITSIITACIGIGGFLVGLIGSAIAMRILRGGKKD